MCDRGSEIQCKERLVRKSNSIGRSGETGYVASPRFLLALNTQTGAGGAVLTALAEDAGLVPSTHTVTHNPL